jgi:hypothetical protein
LVAIPNVNVKGLEVAAVSKVGVKVRVYEPTVPVTTRFENVATPPLVDTVVVPESTPLPLVMDATTLVPEVET